MGQEKTALRFPNLSGGAKKLLGLGAAAGGAAAAGAGGYGLGRRSNELILHQYNTPQGASLYVEGPRDLVEDFQDGVEEVQTGERDPMELEGMVEQAEQGGVDFMMDYGGGFKGASARGRIRARSLSKEASKLASFCAKSMVESGMLSKEAAQPFIDGTHDLRKCARLFETVGVAAYLHDNPQQ